MKNFRDLKVWQRSHHLTLAVYQVTSEFPGEELYGLTSQIRRASSSIPANIAEGCGRRGDLEFARFLQIAMGSACGLEYHLLLARDLSFIGTAHHDRLSADLVELKRMLASLLQKLKADR